MSRFSLGDHADDPNDPFDVDDPFDDDTGRRRSRPRRRSPIDDERPRRPPAPVERDAPDDDPDLPPGASRTTYLEAARGPAPVPSWVITTGTAVDHERGVIKSGKEATVDLLERTDPDSGRSSLLAAKRYRSAEHRLFHRDAGYLEGRRVRRSRETRAMATRTWFGRQLIAGQWAATEFDILGRLWSRGVAVPYPVQQLGTELLLELIGDDGIAAPRLAEVRPGGGELADLWEQCRDVLVALAAAGYTHGDLSAYNILVHAGRVVLIDLPQAVDIAVNPQGLGFLERDCVNICRWFTSRGLAVDALDLARTLRLEANL